MQVVYLLDAIRKNIQEFLRLMFLDLKINIKVYLSKTCTSELTTRTTNTDNTKRVLIGTTMIKSEYFNVFQSNEIFPKHLSNI